MRIFKPKTKGLKQPKSVSISCLIKYIWSDIAGFSSLVTTFSRPFKSRAADKYNIDPHIFIFFRETLTRHGLKFEYNYLTDIILPCEFGTLVSDLIRINRGILFLIRYSNHTFPINSLSDNRPAIQVVPNSFINISIKSILCWVVEFTALPKFVYKRRMDIPP